jgi:hypothetical protein
VASRKLTLLAACASVLALLCVQGVASARLARIEPYTPPGWGRGLLVDGDSGRAFIPRGVNYVRLSPVGSAYHHSTFEPGRYSGAEVEAVLSALQHDGYNTVRVFIDPGSIPDAQQGHPHGLGRGDQDVAPLYGPYMDDVADFVRRADGHGVHVLFAFDGFPQSLYYYRIVGAVDPTAISGHNLWYLHPGHVDAKAAFMRNFVAGLRDRVGADGLGAVLGYQTDNEAYMRTDVLPFSRTTGVVTTADGISYDMGDPAQRQQAQDANFVSYANRMVDAVQSVDPGALVSTGMFTYRAVGRSGPQGLPLGGDPRFPARPAVLARWSKLSFLDLHVYPTGGAGYGLDADLASSEWASVTGKPVIVGEFGALRSQYGGDIARAASAMRDLMAAGCERGLYGWLFWTWDTQETADQQQWFPLVEQQGAINTQLSPIANRRVCADATRPPRPVPPPGVVPPGGVAPPAPRPAKPRLWVRVVDAPLMRALRHGLRVRVRVPAAGRLTASARQRKRVLGRGTRRAGRAGTHTVTVRFSRAARQRLSHRARVRLTVAVTFKPRGGGARSSGRRTVLLRR